MLPSIADGSRWKSMEAVVARRILPRITVGTIISYIYGTPPQDPPLETVMMSRGSHVRRIFFLDRECLAGLGIEHLTAV